MAAPGPVDESQFFETVLRCVADGVFTVDCDWRITSFNRAAERVTGVSAERAVGRRCSEVFHSDLCEHACPIRETLETEQEVIDRPARILTTRGRSVPISVSSAVLRAEDGTLLGAVETFRDLSTLEQLRREITNRYTFEDIIGRSEAFQKIFALMPDIAASESTVLIEGPSGSGKELLARAIHNLSQRRQRPYVVVNCGTLPPTSSSRSSSGTDGAPSPTPGGTSPAASPWPRGAPSSSTRWGTCRWRRR